MQGQRPAAFYAVAAGAIESRFTGEDGRVSVLGAVAPPQFFGLAAFAAGHTHAPDVYHKHFLSIPSVEFVDDDSATARTYFTMLHERPTGPIVLVIGRYLDRLVRGETGWVFAERVVDMEALPPSPGA